MGGFFWKLLIEVSVDRGFFFWKGGPNSFRAFQRSCVKSCDTYVAFSSCCLQSVEYSRVFTQLVDFGCINYIKIVNYNILKMLDLSGSEHLASFLCSENIYWNRIA